MMPTLLDELNIAGAVITAYALRGRWGVESLHWLRGTVYREDNSTVHTRSGPRFVAARGTSRSGHYAWPDASRVQDAGYIAELAERCAARVPQPPPWPTRSPCALRDLVLARRAAHVSTTRTTGSATETFPAPARRTHPPRWPPTGSVSVRSDRGPA